MAPVGLVVGLPVRRGEPGPAAQVPGGGKAADVAYLGHEDGRHDRAHAVEGLDSPVAAVAL